MQRWEVRGERSDMGSWNPSISIMEKEPTHLVKKTDWRQGVSQFSTLTWFHTLKEVTYDHVLYQGLGKIETGAFCELKPRTQSSHYQSYGRCKTYVETKLGTSSLQNEREPWWISPRSEMVVCMTPAPNICAQGYWAVVTIRSQIVNMDFFFNF